MFTNYGDIALAEVNLHAATYFDTKDRNAQKCCNLYLALVNSLTPAAMSKIEVWQDDYHIKNLSCGPLLLKLIIREFHIDRRETVRHICANLSTLKEPIQTINYNIIDFEVYVLQLVRFLNARGEKIGNLLPNLFEPYKVAKDKDFFAYIKFEENDYEQGQDIFPY
jgi:hypothetical protein